MTSAAWPTELLQRVKDTEVELTHSFEEFSKVQPRDCVSLLSIWLCVLGLG